MRIARAAIVAAALGGSALALTANLAGGTTINLADGPSCTGLAATQPVRNLIHNAHETFEDNELPGAEALHTVECLIP